MHRLTRFLLCFLPGILLSAGVSAQSAPFAKFFSFGQSNPFNSTTFVNCHQLAGNDGFLVLAERLTANSRNAIVIRTDSLVQEQWTVMLDFQQAAAPFDNIFFSDIGELPNGNYYIFGNAALFGFPPRYVIFLLDTMGQVIGHKALYDSQNLTSVGNYPQIHVAPDSSLIVGFSEYERFGFYRLDQNLNLLSSGFYTTGTNSWGRDCIFLPDTSLLISGTSSGIIGLTKTTMTGAVTWTQSYNTGGHIKSLYASPNGSIYAGGYATTSTTVAFLAKFTPAGSPVFLKYYEMVPSTGMSAIWNIYPYGNNLMLYSDSVMFVVDTFGNVVGSGQQVVSYNYKMLKEADPGNFILTGIIYQDSVMDYKYSLMRFNNATTSGCLYPRGVTATSATITASPILPVVQTANIVSDSIPFTAVYPNLDYDAVNGCLSDPNGVAEMQELHSIPVFPNPASGEIHIDAALLPSGNISAEIIDVNGRTVRTVSPEQQQGSYTIRIDGLAEGLYFVRLFSGNLPAGQAKFSVVR